MDITTNTSDNTVRIRLAGRIDALEAPKLRDELETHLGTEHALIVDLSDVDFLDSSGLAALVKGWRRHTSGGGSFSVVLPRAEAASRVFDLTGFDQVFDIVAPTDERVS